MKEPGTITQKDSQRKTNKPTFLLETIVSVRKRMKEKAGGTAVATAMTNDLHHHHYAKSKDCLVLIEKITL